VPGEVVIERRFRGPRESGNGGYSCGMLARSLDATQAEVTLRLPPPLERPMEVAGGDGRLSMRDGEVVVAEAEAIDELALEIPEPIGVDEARAAMTGSPLYDEHPFPECFVCGPHRHRRDGLCVVCGPVGPEMVAAPWEVDDTVVDEDGLARPEIVWAALDCPGGIAAMLRPELGVCVLGRLAARTHAGIPEGSTCVAVGWPIDREGRKFHAGSAVFSEDGELLAEGRATWIELKS
jgi:hypothetical protein